MMMKCIQVIVRGVVVALVLESSSPISRLLKPRPFVVEAFSSMGKENRPRSPYASDTALLVSENAGTELSEQIGQNVFGQPPYKIAGEDLSASWIDLVRQNKVSASMKLPPIQGDKATNAMVEYGIRLVEKATETSDETRLVFEEYVHQLGLESDDEVPNPRISDINATLARSQQQNSGSGVDFKQVGNFVTQLQLVRTLRPPPSEGFQEATTSVPPPYNPETDSFVTGPLRLELRPLVGRLSLPILTTPWDVFHNISPADRRGHFLLLPSLMNEETNWRGQSLNKDDCNDLVHLASAIEPAGSMFIGYNSVGAGASQNHIHCHAWPYPSIDSTNSDIEDSDQRESADPFVYAVDNAGAIYDFCDIHDGKVEVSYLKYPCFCLQMSSSVADLNLLGETLAACLQIVGEAPHNVGFFNRISEIDDEEENDENDSEDPIEMVDVFLFARSKERSAILPTLKLGISEMMGVFHAQSEEDLDTLTATTIVVDEEHGTDIIESSMEKALADVSYEDEEDLWNRIVAKLQTLEVEK